MKKFSTYLLVMFMILFWILRIVITVMAQLGQDFMGIEPIDMTFEIVLLFAFLLCAILVVKRKIIGALLYLGLYAIYFGGDITAKIEQMVNGEPFTMGQMGGLLFSIIGIILPLAVLVDLLLDRGRKEHPVDKKTDWFYKNEQFDRKLDDRADKNNYRTL